LSCEWEAISKEDYARVPFAVQVVRLVNNPGVVIGQSSNRKIANGIDWTMLLKAWTTFARGETPSPPPLINQQLLRLPSEERHLVRKPNKHKDNRVIDLSRNKTNCALK
jgi:hypothetical protein